MASSGTYNWTISNGEAVLAAYERVQIRAPEIRAEHMLTARRELNLLLVEAANKQVNLWKVEQFTTTLVQGTATYAAAPRVVMILDAWITTTQGSVQSQVNRYITPLSRTEYASLANPLTQGPPTQYWFDRLIAPTLTTWPVADGNGPYTLNYFACTQMQDANLPGGETPDLPYRWLDWFVAGLAHRFARVYPRADNPNLEAIRKADAKEAWETAATQDVENVNLQLAPGLGYLYRI